MNWEPPGRNETKTAIAQQQGQQVDPGELLYGFTNNKRIEQSGPIKNMPQEFIQLTKLLKEMDACFSRTLPVYFGDQNKSFSPQRRGAERRRKKAKGEGNQFGGTLERYRLPGKPLAHYVLPKEDAILWTSFADITLLHSCPAAIHLDHNGRVKDQHSFTVMTSVGQGFSGGTFCLIEYGYKIPVKPGDLLIAQTTREWHTNISPVQGEKFSVVAYSRKQLSNPVWKIGPSVAVRR
jgi:hypothetical protein